MKTSLIHFMLFAGLIMQMSCTQQLPQESNSEVTENEHSAESGHSCGVPLTSEDSLKYVSLTLEISGHVENLLNLTVNQLAEIGSHELDKFGVVCQTGETKKVNETSKGVLLRDVLNTAEIKQENHKDRNFYIVATATDGYQATFSWAEIFNNPTGDNVYVLFEENGAPIESQGKFILISQNDIKSGPRHVYWLKSIKVFKV